MASRICRGKRLILPHFRRQFLLPLWLADRSWPPHPHPRSPFGSLESQGGRGYTPNPTGECTRSCFLLSLGTPQVIMAVADSQLISWMSHPLPRVRGAALDVLTSSYSNDPQILRALFDAWDRFGPEVAFHDFPLISHLPISAELVDECIRRAAEMAAGRKPTDRTCRCAGKLMEALSVAPANVYAAHLDALVKLKASSKIFFRVSVDSMREKAEAIARASSSLALDFEDGQERHLAIALESLHRRHEAGPWIERGLGELQGENDRTPLATAVLEFASRHPIVGYEERLLPLLEHSEASIADPATIALVRCRTTEIQRLIADRFPKMNRSGQLRSVDIIRRARLPKSSELLRFLLPYGVEFQVQNGIRVAEVLLFDFEALEDWLEALLLADDHALRMLRPYLPLAEPLAQSLIPQEWGRIQQLVESRIGLPIFESPRSA